MRQQMLRAALCAVLWGCGGTSAPAAPAEQPVQASESAGAEASIPDEAPQEAAPSARPATLKVVTKVGSDVAPARVKVFNEGGGTVEGASGEPLAVLSGELEVEATLTDSKRLLGHETLRRSVSVAPGEDATTTVIFERCLVRVVVNIKGKLDPTAVVTLSKDGATIAKLQSGAKDYVTMAPGRYNANVKSRRAEITSSDVTLNEGATQTIPIDVN
jgi:hypothetical protein